ncbi:MAG: hypothetical protein IK093_19895 [Ruminiclostridium sp.]|nr:hypothetical protein [Ruminiclostridium sp.]
MIFQATIQSKDGSVVLDLPQMPSDIIDSLERIGVKLLPTEIRPHDSRIKVSLSSDSDFGKHLIPLFSCDESLADINAAASQIEKAGEYVLADIENNVLYDQYDNIRTLLYDLETDYEPCMGM